MELAQSLDAAGVEKEVLADSRVVEQLAGRTPKRVIVVIGRIVNIVI